MRMGLLEELTGANWGAIVYPSPDQMRNAWDDPQYQSFYARQSARAPIPQPEPWMLLNALASCAPRYEPQFTALAGKPWMDLA